MKSFSLHSSSVYFGSRKTGFSNESDIVSEKSSIGEISSKISWSPDFCESSSPALRRSATLFSHFSFPISQSKLSVWRARSCGTSRGSEILAKEMRRGLLLVLFLLREAAKSGPSEAHMCGGAQSHHKPATGQAGSI